MQNFGDLALKILALPVRQMHNWYFPPTYLYTDRQFGYNT